MNNAHTYDYRNFQPLIYTISAFVYDAIKDKDVKRTLAKITVDLYASADHPPNIDQAYEKLEKLAEKVKKANEKYYKNNVVFGQLSTILASAISTARASQHLPCEKMFFLLSIIINQMYDLNFNQSYQTYFLIPDNFYKDKAIGTILSGLRLIDTKNSANYNDVLYEDYKYILNEYVTKTSLIMKNELAISNYHMAYTKFIQPEKTAFQSFTGMLGLKGRHNVPSAAVYGGRMTRKTKKHVQRKGKKSVKKSLKRH